MKGWQEGNDFSFDDEVQEIEDMVSDLKRQYNDIFPHFKKLKNKLLKMQKTSNYFYRGSPNLYAFLIEKGVDRAIAEDAQSLVSDYILNIRTPYRGKRK